MNVTDIGLLGIGRLGEALACSALALPDLRRLHVTQRGAERVARLQTSDGRVQAVDPTSMLQTCDILLVALRPDAARSVLGALHFETRHHIVSAMAEIGLGELRALTHGAGSASRVLAMPSVALGGQLLPLFPRTAAAEHLFGERNRFLDVASEAELMTYWAITGLLSAVMVTGQVAEGWLMRAGASPEDATAYARTVYSDVLTATAQGFTVGMNHVSTPGGLNEMMLDRLLAVGFGQEIEAGLQAIHDRLMARLSDAPDQA
jgi:pyrroline-5-carboxylate reductase